MSATCVRCAAWPSRIRKSFILEFLNTREGLELNRAFVKIRDPKVRKSVVDLVRAFSANS